MTLTVTDGSGLTNAITKQITVPAGTQNQPPTASITSPAAGSSSVQGTTVSFGGTGSDPEDGSLSGASLVWTSSLDGQIGTGTSFSKTNLSVGTHTITLTATDSKGAIGTASRSITVTAPVNQSPSANITAPAAGSSSVQGTTVSFAGTGSDPEDGSLSGASLVWTSSLDGQIGTGTSFSKTNLSVGTHTITLTVTDSKGATGTTSRSITVTTAPSGNQPPVANFTYNCVGLPKPYQCDFDPRSSTDDVGIVKYAWAWNGRVETLANPVVVRLGWSSPGTYPMTLTVTDGGGLTSSITKQILVP
jgi:PKD repeat protein